MKSELSGYNIEFGRANPAFGRSGGFETRLKGARKFSLTFDPANLYFFVFTCYPKIGVHYNISILSNYSSFR
jgi:hypothetical protein